MSEKNLRPVYFIDGARTPFLKVKKQPGSFSASDLAVNVGKILLQRQVFAPDDLDEVIVGCMMPSENEANIARIIAQRLGCANKVTGWTAQRNCGSGLQAIDSAYLNIATGNSELILAGGTEAASRAPVILRQDMVTWLSRLNLAKTPIDKVKQALKFRIQFLKPVLTLLHGLIDPITGLNMGQTAENIVDFFGLTRTQLDEFSVRSHALLAQAQNAGLLHEIVPMFDNIGNLYDVDDGLRGNCTLETLANLKPMFDKEYGKITAGNSAQVTDGACLMLMASGGIVQKHNLPILGRVVDVAWAGVDPAFMGLGPVPVIASLLRRNHLGLEDIDYYEINEAFSGQILGCLEALKDENLGELHMEKLNVDGGSLAIGHPFSTSGVRIVLHLLHILKRNRVRYGIASLCIGGGQGGAILVENVSWV